MRLTVVLLGLSVLCPFACEAARVLDLPRPGDRHSSLDSDLHSTGEAANVSHIKYTADAEKDRVRFLPGWGAEISFGLFSGYVNVDKDTGKHFFYILTESEEQPKTKPLVLWLNGGPGCSSIAGGFMTENGPFYPASDGLSLIQNHNAWNRVANIIYLDTPAFVGFSYSETEEDKHASDNSTSADNLEFLKGFLKRFPQYEERELWIVGESYAGHYIPTLVEAILEHNEKSNAPKLNLTGYMIGNPDTDPLLDNQGRVEFWYSHAIISNSTAKNISSKCDFSNLIIGPLDQVHYVDPGKDCSELVHKAQKEMGNINIYDIYMDVCTEYVLPCTYRRIAQPCSPDAWLT
jgi:serine carboxypeptidase-like clade 2